MKIKAGRDVHYQSGDYNKLIIDNRKVRPSNDNSRLTIIITIVTLVIAILTWLGFHDFFSIGGRNVVKTKEISIYDRLNKLSPHTNINYFIDTLGKPATSHIDESEQIKYLTFIDPNFYLLAATDKDDNVIYFAVTSRKSDFQPTFKRPDDYNNSFKYITLNKTNVLDIDNSKDFGKPRCFYNFGARRFSYFEGYYEANPGNYQSFYIGVNDAGYINPEISSYMPSFDSQAALNEEEGCKKIPIDFRGKISVNTYLVTDAFEFMPDSTESAKLRFGVDLDEVRIINQ